MQIIESYNATELSKLEKTPYSRIRKDKDYYIPVKILTAQSRATERWYSVRYIRTEDIEVYLEEHSNIKRQVRKKHRKKKKISWLQETNS